MSLYESTIEPEEPRLDYDPAKDLPEPPLPRRMPAFETVKTERGRTHSLPGFTIFTGYHSLGKYAAITIQVPTYQPLVLCDRRSIAGMLRFNRKGGQPC